MYRPGGRFSKEYCPASLVVVWPAVLPLSFRIIPQPAWPGSSVVLKPSPFRSSNTVPLIDKFTTAKSENRSIGATLFDTAIVCSRLMSFILPSRDFGSTVVSAAAIGIETFAITAEVFEMYSAPVVGVNPERVGTLGG